eukprot:5004541-Amphidinium_carterae.1
MPSLFQGTWAGRVTQHQDFDNNSSGEKLRESQPVHSPRDRPSTQPHSGSTPEFGKALAVLTSGTGRGFPGPKGPIKCFTCCEEIMPQQASINCDKCQHE